MLTLLFSNAIYKLFRVNFPGKKSVVTCSGKNFIGGSFLGVVAQGGIIQGKTFGGKNPGFNCPGGNLMKANYPGLIAQEKNIQE